MKRTLVCCSCKGKVNEPRPVFLVDPHSMAIRGPFHARCAKEVALFSETVYEQFKARTPKVGTYLVGQPALDLDVDASGQEAKE